MNKQVVMVFDNSRTLELSREMTKHTWMNPVRAKTGSDLLVLIEGGCQCIMVTRDKFDKAIRKRNAEKRMKELSENLFILFDEVNA
jgi:hypothetical protein